MAKARAISFPFTFQKNGRVAKVYQLRSGNFKTHFLFAGSARQNCFKSFDAACLYLEGEFGKLDTDRANAVSLHPLNSEVKTYSELEHLLREKAPGTTLREAVTFFLAHHKSRRFEPKSVKDCAEHFVRAQKANNLSPSQIATLEKHFRRFCTDYGSRQIHEITTLEVSEWLAKQKDAKTDELWSAKTRTSNLGSLVSLSLFSQDTLKAIPDTGKTEFQKVRRPKKDQREAVEIYTPAEMETLLLAALEHDTDLIPALVCGAFQGLRPAEFHAEGAKRRPLTWEAFIWNDGILHIRGQKVRSKANRDIPLNEATRLWLAPFRGQTGEIWKHRQAHSKKLILLRERAKVRSIYDGFRHSFASYRIRQLKGNLPELAQEMGNSPREIIDSYKRNVTDADASEWFSLKPPAFYGEQISAALDLR